VATLLVERSRSSRALASVIVFWAAYLALLFASSLASALLPPPWNRLGWGVVSSAALILLTLAMVGRDGRTLGDVGVGFGAGSVPRFLAGFVIGLATYALDVAVIGLFVGGLRLVPVTSIDWGGVALTFATLLALSCMEELGFRGYPLRTLVPTLGPWGAQAIVAVAFALSHLLYGWSWNSIVFGVLPSAVLFGAAALASGGLAMPIGLHMALNVAQWAIGEKESAGLFTQTVDQTSRARIEQVAPATGMAVTLAMAAVLWWWHRHGTRRAL
jgi:membrane protease YdiL (CAAX protease family)